MGRAPPSPPNHPPAVPTRRLLCPSTGSRAAGYFLFSLPRADGELGIFHINTPILVSCCFSFPIVWKRAFPHLGQEGGGFPSTARLCVASGASSHPALPEPGWSLGVVQGTGSAGGDLHSGTGHHGTGLWGSPATLKCLWSRGLCALLPDQRLAQWRISASLSRSSGFPGLASPGAHNNRV